MKRNGFTLLETMMTIAIIALLFITSSYGFSALQRSIASQTVDREITNILSVAARNARMGVRGSNWGVYIPYNDGTRTAENMTVFHGDTYATRIVENDLVYPINTDVAFTAVDFSGANPNTTSDHEIVFSQLTGSTLQYGSVTISWYGKTRTITISPDGFILREAL